MAENAKHRWLQISLLILAGEAVFLLPFVFVRIFRPTVLKSLEINNTELGWSFSIYGIVALISYFFGGFIADRFKPRYLIGTALISTAIGGFYLLTLPSPSELMWLYGFWGMTTILLFWAPLIKATRIWGSSDKQARAFGLLDGGRGAVAAAIGFIGISLFSNGATKLGEHLSQEERIETFRSIVIVISCIVAAIGLLVLFLLKSGEDDREIPTPDWSQLPSVLFNPKVWLLMLIVVAAYVGYKITDFFPQYATDVLGMNEYEAGKTGTILMITRPVTALMIALVADRFAKNRLVAFSFLVLIICSTLFSAGLIRASFDTIFILNMLVTGIAVYATRALYFALIEDAKFPITLTGTVVGIVSVIGFTPDIFVGPVSGHFLDNYPGIVGFQWIFGGLLLFSILGLIASFLFMGKTKKGSDSV